MGSEQHILAVGDIHGCLDRLQRLQEEVLPELPPQTRLVLLGDYIDRGPDSAGVLEALLKLRQDRPETVFLLGNHESLLLGALTGHRRELWLLNGGLETLESYGLDAGQLGDLPEAHLEFMRSLALYWQSDEHIFVHAGLRPGLPLEEQSERDLLWIREEFFLSDYDFGKTVVFGHTPFPQPLVRPGRVGIDTGAVYGGRLTCLKLPEKRFFHL